ncbi:MAG: hypothetical protein ABIP94_00305 [Planctomycetota bacterium]
MPGFVDMTSVLGAASSEISLSTTVDLLRADGSKILAPRRALARVRFVA